MNSVALMVALMAVPDTAAFGNKGGGCGGCGDPCGKTGLFGGRIRAFFAKCNLFNKCRSKNACWAPPSGCCGGGGFEVGGMMGGFEGMPMGGMAMGGMAMGELPMGDGMMMGGQMMGGQMGGFPMAMGGQMGEFPMAGGQQFGGGGYPVVMNQQFVQNAPGMAQGGEVQPTYGTSSAYPSPMPSAQGGFQAPTGQTWLNQQPTQSTIGPVLGNPSPVRSAPSAPAIPVPTPIPQAGSGAALPQGPFPGTAPAAAVVAAYATGGEDFAPAKLRFTVPAGAVVYVDGQKVDGNGPVRKFHTPTLPRGRTFFYEFKAEFEVNGVKVVEEKVLPVCAGDELNESFAKLTAAAK